MTRTLPGSFEDAARASADPDAVRLLFGRLMDSGTLNACEEDQLLITIASVAGASRSLTRLIAAEPAAALEELRRAGEAPSLAGVAAAASPETLQREKGLAYLRVAAGDLAGRLGLEEVAALLSRLADAVLEAALGLSGAMELSVVAMGKHGGEELNYASDVDVLFVAPPEADPLQADAAARRALDVASRCYRVDTGLRPEGRNGALVRTLESYEAYWEKWAQPWEFQAMLKARFAAGESALGVRFEHAAREAVFSRRIDADALSELRSMKERSEALVTRRGTAERDVKLGPGGIRDIEFAVQLLQLVHGRVDEAIRSRSTLGALDELSRFGYVDGRDAALLAIAYRFLRTVEHRLQLVEEAQVHTVPAPGEARKHIGRLLGFPSAEGVQPRRAERFDIVLGRYQSSVRSIHERLYFRPLLEVFSAAGEARISEAAFTDRLYAFGFRDPLRTRQALGELTRGLTRSSRLMQQLLAVLLGWLSETPDPDLGLLGLRNLSSLPHQRDVVVAAFRDSPELARRLCVVLGTSRRLGELVQHYPAVALSLGDDDELFEKGRSDLSERALAAAGGGGGRAATSIRRLVGSETLRTAAADLFLVSPGLAASRRLSALADVTLEAALEAVGPSLPFAVVAMGRLGGEELAYASDLDVLFVYEGGRKNKAAEAEQAASRLLSLLNGSTPAERIWTVDASLRPEGKQGPLARSLDAYAEYYDRWMAPWERQALLRARPVGGDEGLLDAFMALVERTLWERPFGEEETREIRRLKARTERERIPAGEDPQFHLKLGRGSLADIEWTTQLLQLRNGVPATTTAGALAALANGGVLEEPDRAALATALAYLTATRNRWHLVGNYLAGAGGVVGPAGADSLPQPGEALSRLARSLGKRPTDLRQEYRRVTRRARRVVERLFYGLPAD